MLLKRFLQMVFGFLVFAGVGLVAMVYLHSLEYALYTVVAVVLSVVAMMVALEEEYKQHRHG